MNKKDLSRQDAKTPRPKGEERIPCSATMQAHVTPKTIQPQRNAKNAKTGTYGVLLFVLQKVRIARFREDFYRGWREWRG
jgi:hypothetical protein